VSVLVVKGLGLRTRRGWVFRDVDLEVRSGDLVALTGPAGSGRTSLLLALAGHFRTSAGTRRLSGRAGIGLVPGISEPESGLTAAEHVRERRLLLKQRGPRAELPVDGRTLGRDLTPYQRQRLMLALATTDEPELVVVDDVDLGLSTAERAELWQALTDLADQGYAVVATCREAPGAAIEFPMEGHR
jgi:ABC-2 type transport system ATP-binding protein